LSAYNEHRTQGAPKAKAKQNPQVRTEGKENADTSEMISTNCSVWLNGMIRNTVELAKMRFFCQKLSLLLVDSSGEAENAQKNTKIQDPNQACPATTKPVFILE